MGRILAPHGISGGLKIRPFSSEPDALLSYSSWWIAPPGAREDNEHDWQIRTVLGGRLQQDLVVAQLEGIVDRDAGLGFRGWSVGIPREALPQAPEGEFYQADLIGFTVVNREGIALGRVTGWHPSSAHPVLRVVAAEDARERLVPFVSAIVDGVDVALNRIVVDWKADY